MQQQMIKTLKENLKCQRELLLTTEDHKVQAIEPSLQDYRNDIKKQ